MKNGMKFLAVGAALFGAAVGVAAYRKYRDSYEQLPEDNDSDFEILESESDFEEIIAEEDGFTYYVEDADQILFYE